MKSALKTLVPKPIYATLRRFKRAAYALYLPLPDAQALPASYRHLPGQFDFITLESYLAQYDAATPEYRRTLAHGLFYTIALEPMHGQVVSWEYTQRKHGSHVLYRYLRAAWYYGTGAIDEAVKILSALAEQRHESLAILLAGACLLRPNGREQEARAILLRAHQQFPDDIAIAITLAQAHFVLRETIVANHILAAIETPWRAFLKQHDKENTETHNELQRALSKRTTHRHSHYDDTIYAESQIKLHWEPYYRDMLGEPAHVFFGWLRRFYVSAFDEIIANEPQTDAIINFGVMCGQADYEAACQYPDIQFYGVDRQQATKDFNDMAYQSPNLEFLAGDIETLLPLLVKKHKSVAFFHARTATLLYPERMRALYKQCAALSVRHISLFENLAPNHHAYRYFDYADFPQDAIIYKNHQFIHHYPRYLEEAGYRVVAEQRVASPSVQADSAIDWGSVHVYLRATLVD